jgi:hypothetical protein
VLLSFASNVVGAADSPTKLIQVLTSVDRYVDRIAGA